MSENLFLSYKGPLTAADVSAALQQLGLGPGDTIFAHSGLSAFGFPQLRRQELTDALLDCFFAVIGPHGTLAMPTFTYSFCRGEIYDPITSASRMGALNERLRCREGSRRTPHPLFSAAVAGCYRDPFCRIDEDSFGPRSIFAHLHGADGWLVFFGVSPQFMTFVHYAEQARGVDYRQFKEFYGQVRLGKTLAAGRATFYCRRLDWNVETNLDRLRDDLAAAGEMRTVTLGGAAIAAIRARDAFNQILRGLDRDQYYLLAGDPRPQNSFPETRCHAHEIQAPT